MKVLTILNSASIGGIEKTLLSCLKNMPQTKVDMTILCFQRGGVLEKDFKELGVNFLYIKKTGIIILDMIQLCFLLLKHKFDIVHSRFGFTSGGFVLASRLTNTKVYVSLHSTHPSTFKALKRKKILYELLSFHLKIHKYITKTLATKIIGHSKSNLDNNYPRWNSSTKYELLYNGVDFDELENDLERNDNLDIFIKDEDFVILHIGSFRKPKNHLFLIDCFNSLDPKTNNYKLILVGQGGLVNVVKEKVSQMGISDCCFFAGFDKKINKYFNKSHLFFFPSLNEGLANVLIEAQYKKLPICASDIPPIYESGYKGYHQYYFDFHDKKVAVENLNKIIEDIKKGYLKNTIIEAKKYAITNFSIQSMVQSLLKLYDERL
ncbi:MAG: glycosyltransferase [Endomicrobium sp.]|jgi:glycosyltransferase involved in cell wall biosynthesis|nr:glycosyltransferase [Endomicrobium sp.]